MGVALTDHYVGSEVEPFGLSPQADVGGSAASAHALCSVCAEAHALAVDCAQSSPKVQVAPETPQKPDVMRLFSPIISMMRSAWSPKLLQVGARQDVSESGVTALYNRTFQEPINEAHL